MRNALIKKLADEMRYAETYFIETEDDCKKWNVVDNINKAKFTKEERKEWEDMCNGMGV